MREPTPAKAAQARACGPDSPGGDDRRRDPIFESALVIALALVGALMGAAVLFADKPWGAFDSKKHLSEHLFTQQPETIFWVCLICAQTALWLLLSLPIGRALRTVPRPKRRSPTRLATLVLVVALAGFVLVARRVRNHYPLPHHADKITVLTALGFLLAILAATVVWRLSGQASQYTTMAQPTKKDLHGLMRLQETLARMLAIQGAVIGAAVLATAALRRALIAWNNYADAHPHLDLKRASEIPYLYVLIYGGFFSLLLALIYFPTFLETQAAGRRLRDLAADLPAPGDQTFDSILTRRKNLDDLLQLQVATSTSFRAGVAIVAPLTSALLGLLFKA